MLTEAQRAMRDRVATELSTLATHADQCVRHWSDRHLTFEAALHERDQPQAAGYVPYPREDAYRAYLRRELEGAAVEVANWRALREIYGRLLADALERWEGDGP